MKKILLNEETVFIDGTIGKFWSFCFRNTIDNSFSKNNTVYKRTNYVYQKSQTEFRIKTSPYINNNINKKIFLKDPIQYYFLEGKLEEKDKGLEIHFYYVKNIYLGCLTSIIAIIVGMLFIGLAAWMIPYTITDMDFWTVSLPIIISAGALFIVIIAIREIYSNIKNDYWESQLSDTKEWFLGELEKVCYTKDEYKKYKEAFVFNDRNYVKFTLGVIPVFLILGMVSLIIKYIIYEIDTEVSKASIDDAAYSMVAVLIFYFFMLILAEISRNRRYKMKLGIRSKIKKRIFIVIFTLVTVSGLLNVII